MLRFLSKLSRHQANCSSPKQSPVLQTRLRASGLLLLSWAGHIVAEYKLGAAAWSCAWSQRSMHQVIGMLTDSGSVGSRLCKEGWWVLRLGAVPGAGAAR
eukprot:scaffold105056_cov23-Tisochrysis_lutea.AAC.2